MCVYTFIQIIMVQKVILLLGQWGVFLVKKYFTHLYFFKMECLQVDFLELHNIILFYPHKYFE